MREREMKRALLILGKYVIWSKCMCVDRAHIEYVYIFIMYVIYTIYTKHIFIINLYSVDYMCINNIYSYV